MDSESSPANLTLSTAAVWRMNSVRSVQYIERSGVMRENQRMSMRDLEVLSSIDLITTTSTRGKVMRAAVAA